MKAIQLANSGALIITRESGNKKREHTYNPNKNTLRNKLEVEVEEGKKIIIDDYTGSDGTTKREILFNLNNNSLNKIRKNGKKEN